MRERKQDKRKLQGAETKKRLFEIAKREFSEKDFETVMVEDITDEAGITKGAFYTHFESKDALIAAVVADTVAHVDADYRTFVEHLPADMRAGEKLLALTGKIADTMTDDIGCQTMRRIYQQLLAGALNGEAVKGYGREIYALLCDIFEVGQQRGEIKNVLPVRTLARHYVAAFRGVGYEWCIHAPDFDLKEQVMALIGLLLEGLCEDEVVSDRSAEMCQTKCIANSEGGARYE